MRILQWTVGCRAGLVALAFLVLVVPVAPAAALAGSGRVITDFAGLIDRARAVVVQPDGRIVVAGATGRTFAIARYNTNGSLDTSFGSGGKVTTPVPGPSSTNYVARAVAIQPDGKIVAGGARTRIVSGIVFPGAFVVIRYQADGSLDTGFGTDGIAQAVFPLDGDPLNVGFDMAILNDGRIIQAGMANNHSFALARYNPNGSLDAGFGDGGLVTTKFGNGSTAHAMVVQSDGRIVAAGRAGQDFGLARYNPNGALDPAFGNGGLVTTDFAGASDLGEAAIGQPDGRLVVAGFGGDDVELARYNTNGTLDTTFGNGGRVTTDFANTPDEANGVALAAGGRIVIAGRAGGDFGLARYNPDGSLDTTFGNGGRVTTDFAGNDDLGNAIAIQRDGRLLVVGSTANPRTGTDFALARYNPDGSPDTTFGR